MQSQNNAISSHVKSEYSLNPVGIGLDGGHFSQKMHKTLKTIKINPHNYHPTYRPDIDGLRAFSILAVVIFHAFPQELHGGFIGVDIFFVISGFLISSIIFRSLQYGDFSFAEFYAHRIKRIFPALIAILFACYITGWLVLMADEYTQLGKHIATGAGFIQNFVLWKEAGYFDVASELKPLMHLWSLAVEEQFYLVYPLLIWGAWRLKLNLLGVIILLGLLSFGLNLAGIYYDHNAARTFFLPHTRFWELLAGAVLAHAYIFHPKSMPSSQNEERIYDILSITGLLFIVISVLAINQTRRFPGLWALLPVSGACLLVFSGPNAWVNRKLLSHRAMVSIGLISYPLYLWHWPLLSFARIMKGSIPAGSTRLAILILSFTLAWITYRLLERPIRFGRQTWAKTTILSLVLVAIGFVGYNTYEREGMPFRLTEKWLVGEQYVDGQFDRVETTDPTCLIHYPGFEGYCRVSASGTPTILLVGDSHANQLFPSIAEIAAQHGDIVVNFGTGHCPPFFDTETIEQGTPVKCVPIINKALSFAETNDSVRTVIMVSRGPLYTAGQGWGDLDKGVELQRAQNPNLGSRTEIFEIGMRETLTKLLNKKKQVVFVLDNPELDFDPRSCVSLKFRQAAYARTRCAVPRQIFDERQREYRDLVIGVLRDFPQVKLLDSSAPFCDDQWCWAMKNGSVFYQDTNHLATPGSRLVAQQLKPLLFDRAGATHP